ncbi:hypothetical protein MVEN_02342500 [Mycena venus]|uniref:60S ribosomal protein L31 n=1 Tax=Mycena venus TaxID=2733690 RepID=A0A8H6X3M6_9AGAR|nr:hypothetical protein MVEN_02342500 [Mycena venus]
MTTSARSLTVPLLAVQSLAGTRILGVKVSMTFSAVNSVIEFAQKTMDTSDVRIDPELNKEIWARGIKSVPHWKRVKLECKWNDKENAKEKL